MTEHLTAPLIERHRRVLPSWLTLYYDEPIALVRGEGRTVWDADGRRYLDFFGGILTTSTAYALPEVVEAVQRAAATMMHSSTLYLIEAQVELAELIAELSGIPDAKVFFTSSGSEANEAALLMATSTRRSNQVLAIRNSYHGRSFGTIALTGNRNWRASAYSPLSVGWVHGGYRYRSPWRDLDDAEYAARCVADLRDVIATATSGDVAALIYEPIQGVGGFAIPPDGMFGEMRKVLGETGILTIADEVQTGWGRTGEHFWGWQAHHAEPPDLVTFAKGLGNGLAVGGVVGRADIVDSVAAGSISTFGGNPLAMAGALANLRYILDHDLHGAARERGARLRTLLEAAAVEHACVGEVRGRGLMQAVELVVPGSTEPDPAAAARVMEETRRRGLLVGKGGLHGNVLRIAPPMTVTDEEIAAGAQILADSLAVVSEGP